jgi:hypothetical protein
MSAQRQGELSAAQWQRGARMRGFCWAWNATQREAAVRHYGKELPKKAAYET